MTSSASVETFAESYCAAVCSNYFLYPYRDYTKTFVAVWPPSAPGVVYVSSRYRGFIDNPFQLAIISAPPALLYTGFVMVGGGAAGACVGGFCFGAAKAAIRMLGARMQHTKRNYELQFRSISDCVRTMSQEQGAWSWLCGAGATSLIAVAWHGSALVSLQQREHWQPRGFFSDWWAGFRAHAFLAFVTCPLRNTFRSSLAAVERSGGVRSARDFFRGEAAVFQEAGSVAPAMLRTQGIRFFLDGCIRTTFKSSIPFGFTYAVFRFAGGRLDHKNSPLRIRF